MRNFMALVWVGLFGLLVCFSSKSEENVCNILLQTSPERAAKIEKARIYSKKNALEWINQKKCLSCHTVLSYVIGQNAKPSRELGEESSAIVDYIGDRLENWTERRPWYPSKASESDSTELIISAFARSQFEKSGAIAVSSQTMQSIRLMTKFQEEDGSLPWLNYSLQPLESADAKSFGAALAAVTFSTLDVNQRQEFSVEIENLKKYLRKEWSKPETADVNRLNVVWASSKLKGILSDSEIQETLTHSYSGQLANGGIPIESVSAWTANHRPSISPAQANSYATSYLLYVTQMAGMEKNDHIAAKFQLGTHWLQTNQLEDGSWQGVSLNSNRAFNNRLASDLATGFGLAVLSHRVE